MLLGWSSGCINSAISHQHCPHYTGFDVFFDISLNIRMLCSETDKQATHLVLNGEIWNVFCILEKIEHVVMRDQRTITHSGSQYL